MAKKSITEIPAHIRAKWNCVAYARDVLGFPVFKDGDRCVSIAPGPHTHNDGLIIHDDYWYDYSDGKSGDVIDLCAIVRHNGDKGEAMRELGAEFFTGFTPAVYHKHSLSLQQLIEKWHSQLRPEDRAYLHDRRITDETIDRLKLGYCGWVKSGMYDRIIIPYWKNGKVVYYAGRDCSGKWKDKTSGVSKYKKMWTGKNEFSENVMWGLHTLGRDWCIDPEKDKYLCILEGQFDVMSFEQCGWHVLSPIGGRFAKKLMPQLKSICKRFEKVFICMDNDGPGVTFQRDMAKFLFSNNIPFVCGHVQGEYSGQKIKDVSDYYTLGGDLSELVATANDGIADLARTYHPGDESEFYQFMMTAGRFVDSAKLVMFAKNVDMDKDFVKECIKAAKKSPLESTVAKEILSEHELLYMVNDGIYEYEHGVWRSIPFVAVQNMARIRLGNFATASLTAQIAKHIQIINHSTAGFNTQNIINMHDGVLDLQTMELREHSPAFMTTIQIPRVYDADAQCPKWLEFIRQVMDGESDKELLLQEMAGYIFMPDNKLNQGFFLMGDGANGKSVFLEVLRYVIDPRNCSNVELSNMADRFEPLRLKDSLVNFSTETRVDLKGAEAAIKKVISGETMSAAHKGVDAVEFVPRCKIFCACNNFIHSKDISHGFVRRVKLVDFPKIFTKKTANPNLTNELKEEAAGILNWMIEGWRILNASGKFIETKEEERMKEEFLTLANPLAGFIRERLSGIFGAEISSVSLFNNEYLMWATESNVGKMGKYVFGRTLSSLMRYMRPDVVQRKNRDNTVYIFPEAAPKKDNDEASEWTQL